MYIVILFFKADCDAENDSAVANKRQKYEGGGMDTSSFYGSPSTAAAAAAGASGKRPSESGGAKGEEERRDVSGDDSVENGGERAKGKGEINYETELVALNLPPARCCIHAT